ncbi:MAG: UDP-N-acetylmuramoyl-L-alanine--D-glutamate ligase [Treponema sp.]|jgi:UDP-N-acetylmuramoylalanine--D-glutamate ligase|nr:UDP-N-acetylmuramoyl-L-alanine--D-glutamate ligase [Treponema sp.]
MSINYSGMKVLVMGLGLNGGGLASALYAVKHGADLVVTDLRDERDLAPSLEKLSNALPIETMSRIRFVLGKHEISDFANADMVIKNPGAHADSPFLRFAARIETDISLFLASSPARLTAVTGSKGKSGTASAIHWSLQKARESKSLFGKAFLGGNIAVSPLSFLDELKSYDDVVLELSSWQLGDLKGKTKCGNPCVSLLKPRVAVVTAILPDHQNYYNGMEDYVADKRVICHGQDEDDVIVVENDHWGQSFLAETKARPLVYADAPLPQDVAGGWLEQGRGFVRTRSVGKWEKVEIVPTQTSVPGQRQKKNLLAAGLALLDLGLPASFVSESLGTFPGIEHRLEFFCERNGIRFYNDTAATIPEAAAAAVAAFDVPIVLVAGGADKNLDFAPLVAAAAQAKAVVLLEGTACAKLKALLKSAHISYFGPFDNIGKAASVSEEVAAAGDIVMLSPGCASFGMFQNEFDRGNQWKAAVRGNL